VVWNKFKHAAIKERIRLCELERLDLLKMLTTHKVNLAWVSERMQSIETELRFLYRDLDSLESREVERWN
jgi:hypothetical protein